MNIHSTLPSKIDAHTSHSHLVTFAQVSTENIF
uniref:Uncharacterized protein n=1 Tax=Arundo donax TaxID=35708 RepID=A0A0A8Z6S7_ARUDO